MKWTRRRLRRKLPQIVTAVSLVIATVAIVGVAHAVQRPSFTVQEREAFGACLDYITRTDHPYPAPGSTNIRAFHSTQWQHYNRAIHALGYATAIDVGGLYETDRQDFENMYVAERERGIDRYWVLWVGEYPDTVACTYTTFQGGPWGRPTLIMRDGVVTE